MVKRRRFLSLCTCVALPLLWTAATPVGAAECVCVEECLDDPGVDVLELLPATQCVQPGQEFVVELHQRNLDQLVRGFQAFMCFDPDCLQVIEVVPTDDPYAKHILNQFDNVAGTIDLIRGIDDAAGQLPTDVDALLATITFLAIAECCDLDPEVFGTTVCFREHLPPTRFGDKDGYPVYPCLKFARVKIDGTAPEFVMFPPDFVGTAALECDECEGVFHPDCTGWPAVIDNCDPEPELSYEDEKIPGDCEDNYTIIRHWTAEDCSGNSMSRDQIIEVVDTTPPEWVECPPDLVIECDQCEQPIDPDCTGWCTATDNCDPDPDVGYEDEIIPGDCEDEYTIIRTWTATDRCGNSAPPRQQIIEVVDTTPPEWVEFPPDYTGDEALECDECDGAFHPDCTGWPTAEGNCDPDPDVDYEDEIIPGDCEDEYTIIRTWTATDRCGNSTSKPQTIEVVDTTTPVFDEPFPPDFVDEDAIECDECEGVFHPDCTGWASAKDNCDPDPDVTYEDEIIPGDCEDEYTIIRTWTATDRCGNSTSKPQTIEVVDTTDPVFEEPFPPDFVDEDAIECDQPYDPDHTGWATATDNCDPDPAVTWDDEKILGDCEDEYTIIRTWTATDRCGNSTSKPQTIEVVDTTPPEFPDGCEPGLIKVFPDVGTCEAYVSFETPVASDNCDDAVEVYAVRDDGLDITAPFPIGNTTVYWVAEDNCGNMEVCSQVVQVEPDYLLEVYVELQGILVSPLQRCIHFEVWSCLADEPVATLDETILFVSDMASRSMGTAQLRLTACDGDVPFDYDCMTAQDRLHTLRSTCLLELKDYTDPVDGTLRTKYVAEYKDKRNPADPDEIGHWLIGGNFDFCLWPDDCVWPECDYWVDILDFAVYSNQWGQKYRDGLPVDEPPVNGNTPCPACDYYPHADANGDGWVDTIDFSFIFVNILEAYEPNCCGQPGAPAPMGRGPIMEISVQELYDRGWSELGAGDLNGDGWVNMADIEAFLQGARPKVKPVPANGVQDQRAAERSGGILLP